MLADSLLPIPFWAKAFNTASYVQNRVLVTKPHNKTPYELLHGRTPSIGFMRPFGCPMTILNTLDPLGKFEGKVDEGFLVGYSINSKAFRVFNSRTRNQSNSSAGFQDEFNAKKARQEINQQYVLFAMWSSGFTNPQNNDKDVAFDEKEHDAKKPESAVNVSPSSSAQLGKQDDKTKNKAKGKSSVKTFTGNRDLSAEFEDYSDNSSNDVNAVGSIVPTVGQNSSNSTNPFSATDTTISPTHRKSSFKDASQLLDNPDMLEMYDINYSDHENVGAEADFNNLETFITVGPIPTTRTYKDHPVSQIIEEPKRVHQALKDLSWIEAMQEELLQFKMQKVWILVDLPHGKGAIGFEDPDHPDKVYKVVKALYGLHQAPRAWYETLVNYLIENGFHKGNIDQTLFIKKEKRDILLVQIYVKQKKDGIFIIQDKYVAEILKKFGLTEGKSASTPIDIEKPLLKDPDGEDVDVHIYRSMISSLMYLTLSRPDIMFAVYACACFQVTPKASHLHAVKRIFRYLRGKLHLGLWYPKDSPFDLVAYSDSDYAGVSLDRKSTTRGCQFLGCRWISWQCKKQTVVATSSIEAEYVAAAS
uniref:Putative ribonuclease H-like domain-containing protein n=1 Tax=Tanacetum cinerariifolium TaxID=118510 RepID=A0A6L2MXW9_TANCI|nr:putative ribonuclease H-like domain-containing protein [Tanacetum cinerariifolium]